MTKLIRRIAVALLLSGLAAQTDIQEPFGIPTEPAPRGVLWDVWRDLQAQIQADLKIVAQCRAAPDKCPSPAALQFIAIVKEGEHHDGLARMGRINRAVNFAIRPISRTASDDTNVEWTSPLAALAAKTGDCKQYAVLKYAALGDAGFAPDDLRLIVGAVKSQGTGHAVVAVRHAGRWYIADNRSLAVVDSRELPDYRPQYQFEHRGVRQFMRPTAPQVAGMPCAAAG